MMIRQTALYEQFRCAGGSCPDTCCGGWNIDIDEDSLAYYGSIRGKFGTEIRRAVNWEENCFLQTGHHCRLLTPEGLCSLQVKLGEEALCDTCRMYPRHCEEYPGIQEYSVGLSCPEAVRLLLTMEDPFQIRELAEEEEAEWTEEELEDFDAALYDFLGRCQPQLSVLLQNQALPLRERVIHYLTRAQLFQDQWDQQDFTLIEDSIDQTEIGTDSGFYQWKLQTLEILEDLDPVRASWSPVLRKLRCSLYVGERSYLDACHSFYQALAESEEIQSVFERGIERILNYCLLLYWQGAAYDGWIFARAGMGVFFVSVLEDLLILQLTEKQELFNLDAICTSLCALLRETEHQDENLNRIIEFMDKNPMK